jgi:hypothetical protein
MAQATLVVGGYYRGWTFRCKARVQRGSRAHVTPALSRWLGAPQVRRTRRLDSVFLKGLFKLQVTSPRRSGELPTHGQVLVDNSQQHF